MPIPVNEASKQSKPAAVSALCTYTIYLVGELLQFARHYIAVDEHLIEFTQKREDITTNDSLPYRLAHSGGLCRFHCYMLYYTAVGM